MSATGRNDHFERIYALPRDVSDVLPQTPLAYGPSQAPELSLVDPAASRQRGISGTENNVLELTRIAARALGIARPGCVADYFRQQRAPTDEAIRTLLETGELIEVDVEGTRALKWHTARTPRRVDARALLVPFDPWSSTVRGSNGSSTSTIGSRSTLRPRTECTGTMCCRSSSANASSVESTCTGTRQPIRSGR